jgi:hypothetical protein
VINRSHGSVANGGRDDCKLHMQLHIVVHCVFASVKCAFARIRFCLVLYRFPPQSWGFLI